MSNTTHHVVPIRVYMVIFVALLVLTAVTIRVAHMDLGAFNVTVALGIAGVKAMLVTMWFMHLRYSPRLVWLTFAAGVVWLVLLVLITMTDYVSRGWLPYPGK